LVAAHEGHRREGGVIQHRPVSKDDLLDPSLGPGECACQADSVGRSAESYFEVGAVELDDFQVAEGNALAQAKSIVAAVGADADGNVLHHVLAVAGVENVGVVAKAAGEVVVIDTAGECVIAGRRIDGVVARAAVQDIGTGRAGDDVVAGQAERGFRSARRDPGDEGGAIPDRAVGELDPLDARAGGGGILRAKQDFVVGSDEAQQNVGAIRMEPGDDDVGGRVSKQLENIRRRRAAAVVEDEIGIMICFDWYYPEAARTLAMQGADIICHPSNLVLPNCPDSMPVRCLENRVFAVTCNRIGSEARGGKEQLTYIGQSEVVTPKGIIQHRASHDQEELTIVEIEPTQARNKSLNRYNDLLRDRRTSLYKM
jgi:hypothetical protein